MSAETINGQIVDLLNQQLYSTLPVIVASDNPGANLVLRSTNSPQKGAVIIDEPTQSYGPQSGALQLSGGLGVQGNIFAGGQSYFVPAFTGIGAITLAGNGAGYTTYQVPLTISPPQVSNGITAQAFGIADSATGGITKIFVYNPGFGYLSPPTVTINDPYATALFWQPNTQYSTNTYLKVATTSGQYLIYLVTVAGTTSGTAPSHTFIQANTSATSTNSTTITFASQPSGTTAGNTVFGVFDPTTGLPITATVITAGASTVLNRAVTVGSGVQISFAGQTASNGTTTLAYVGTTAAATSSIGLTGIVYNGAISGVGSIVNVFVQSGGSSFQQDISKITFSPPHVPSGRTATGYITVSGGAVTGVTMTDVGSGYLYPPTVTISGPGTAAVLVPILGNPGHRPTVGVQPNNMPSSGTFTLDFGMTGHHSLLLNSNAAFTIAADSTKGFPQGRTISVAIKNSGANNLTLSGFTAANNNKNSLTIALPNPGTAFLEFKVLGYSNAISDVYVNILIS
jgi:hypothetical protein